MMYAQTPIAEKGFTLVETLVAVTILLLVITGPLTISMSTARSTEFASEQVVAFFLAQEGAELAQKARDEIMLPGLASSVNNWNNFANHAGVGVGSGLFLSPCYLGTGCGLEVNKDANGTLTVKDCGVSATTCLLSYNSGAVRSPYTYSTGIGTTPTKYTRTIYFEKGAGDYDVKVTSKVTWRTGNLRQEQKVVVETFLFDIYDN
jgi:prepilin-type N-terminal cleavage/methylation domain-containing protein